MERPGTLIVAEEVAAALLREEGHDVVPIFDSQALVVRAEDRPPDAIVLDAAIGPLGAAEVCQKIKRLHRFIPILVVGGRLDALRAGAEDVLAKPYDPKELLARVEVLVRTSRRFQARATEPAASGIVDEGERDRLTGLGNQRFFTRRLDDELRRATHASDTLSVMAVDLDGLDDVNGRYGRGAGDRLIVACARALERACRDGDIVARAGGDELVAILPRLHFAGAAQVAERVLGEIAATAVLEGGARISCQASVGVASYPSRDVESATDLLRFAHAALARAKAEGRGQVCLYQHHGYLIGS